MYAARRAVAAKTLANSIAIAAPATALSMQTNLPNSKDLNCLAHKVLNIAANTITRQIS